MMISLFTFGLSWAVYAFTFYGITRIMPQFHSDYSQSTFTVAFLIGFLDAAFLKAIRVMHFHINLAFLFVLSLVLNILLVFGTNHGADSYYVTGHKAPIIAGTILAVVMMAMELIKTKFFSDIRL